MRCVLITTLPTGVESEPLDSIYYGTNTIETVGSKTPYNVTVDQTSDTVYQYCLQDLLRMPGRSFPALPKFQPEGGEWMTEEQEQVTTLYGWTSLGILGIVALSFIWGMWKTAKGLFRSSYEVRDPLYNATASAGFMFHLILTSFSFLVCIWYHSPMARIKALTSVTFLQ